MESWDAADPTSPAECDEEEVVPATLPPTIASLSKKDQQDAAEALAAMTGVEMPPNGGLEEVVERLSNKPPSETGEDSPLGPGAADVGCCFFRNADGEMVTMPRCQAARALLWIGQKRQEVLQAKGLAEQASLGTNISDAMANIRKEFSDLMRVLPVEGPSCSPDTGAPQISWRKWTCLRLPWDFKSSWEREISPPKTNPPRKEVDKIMKSMLHQAFGHMTWAATYTYRERESAQPLPLPMLPAHYFVYKLQMISHAPCNAYLIARVRSRTRRPQDDPRNTPGQPHGDPMATPGGPQGDPRATQPHLNQT